MEGGVGEEGVQMADCCGGGFRGVGLCADAEAGENVCHHRPLKVLRDGVNGGTVSRVPELPGHYEPFAGCTEGCKCSGEGWVVCLGQGPLGEGREGVGGTVEGPIRQVGGDGGVQGVWDGG